MLPDFKTFCPRNKGLIAYIGMENALKKQKW